jgi:ABC-2 type transport system permease protein
VNAASGTSAPEAATTYGVDGVRAFMLGQDVMTVFDETTFSGLWNTVIPAVAVLVGFNVVLGGIAIRLLNRAPKTEVQ